MNSSRFSEWCAAQVGPAISAIPHLDRVFEVAVWRIENSVGRRLPDPIAVMSNTACTSSRRLSAEMLGQLGFSREQIRIVRRLLAGSNPRWPGLLRLFVEEAELDPLQRRYVWRQLRELRAAAVPGAREAPVGLRSGREEEVA